MTNYPKENTMNIPDTLPTLSGGAHEAGAGQVCAMEAAAWLANEKHSDRPECVHPAIAEFARRCNDASTDAERQTLWPLILRSMGTASNDHVLNVRLAIWCAAQVPPEFESRFPNDDRPRKAIEAAESWADCPCDKHRDAARYAAYAARYAAYAATKGARAAANDATNAAACATNAVVCAKRRELWTGLLDEYDRLTGRTVTEPTAEDWNRLKKYAR